MLDICRICFADNIKTYRLEHTRYNKILEWFMDMKIDISNEWPYSICYICNAFLKKTFNFFKYILENEFKIRNILRNTSKLTYENIEKFKTENILKPHYLSKRHAKLIAFDANKGHTTREPRELQKNIDDPPANKLQNIPKEQEPGDIKDKEIPSKISNELLKLPEEYMIVYQVVDHPVKTKDADSVPDEPKDQVMLKDQEDLELRDQNKGIIMEDNTINSQSNFAQVPLYQDNQITEDGDITIKIESVDEEFRGFENQEINVPGVETLNNEVTGGIKDKIQQIHTDAPSPDVQKKITNIKQLEKTHALFPGSVNETTLYASIKNARKRKLEKTSIEEIAPIPSKNTRKHNLKKKKIQEIVPKTPENYAIRNKRQISRMPIVLIRRLPIEIIKKHTRKDIK